MSSMLTPDQTTNNWLAGITQSPNKYKQKIERLTENPLEAAASPEASARYIAGIQHSEATGKRIAGLRRVPFSEWKRLAATKGASRLVSGATEAKGKYLAFMTQFLPHLEAGVAKLKAMPRGDLNQNIQRAVAMMQHNAEFKRS